MLTSSAARLASACCCSYKTKLTFVDTRIKTADGEKEERSKMLSLPKTMGKTQTLISPQYVASPQLPPSPKTQTQMFSTLHDSNGYMTFNKNITYPSRIQECQDIPMTLITGNVHKGFPNIGLKTLLNRTQTTE